jgi:hypothetical protein
MTTLMDAPYFQIDAIAECSSMERAFVCPQRRPARDICIRAFHTDDARFSLQMQDGGLNQADGRQLARFGHAGLPSEKDLGFVKQANVRCHQPRLEIAVFLYLLGRAADDRGMSRE